MSTKANKSFNRDFYSKLVSFTLSDEQSGHISSEDNIAHIQARSKNGDLLIFSCDGSMYLFELMVEKNYAEIYYICEQELFNFDKHIFINSLVRQEVLSSAGADFALNKIEQQGYIAKLSQELNDKNKRIKTQQEVIFKELSIFKVINLLEDVEGRGSAFKRIKDHILSILKFELGDQSIC
jgi:hypothetical protein